MIDQPLLTIVVYGVPICTSEDGAQAIERLGGQLNDAEALNESCDVAAAEAIRVHRQALDSLQDQLDRLRVAHAAALDAKDIQLSQLRRAYDTTIGGKDGEIAALKALVPSADGLNLLVEERMDVLARAQEILGSSYYPAGIATDQMRREVLRCLGEMTVANSPDEFMRAYFDGRMAVLPRRDPLVDAFLAVPISHGRSGTLEDAQAEASAAKHARNHCLENAWKADPAN